MGANGDVQDAKEELVTAETKLATAKEELATAKEELATAKEELVTAETKFADAQKKWIEATEEPLKARYSWMMDRATSEVNRAEKAIFMAEKAMGTAQELVDHHQAKVIFLDSDHSTGKETFSGSLVPQHREYWRALGDARIVKGEGVVKACGDPYEYEVLDIGAGNPFMNDIEEHTKIIIRDVYHKVWKKVDQELGKKYNLLVRGPPGIGKSVAFAAGFLLYQLRQTMMDDNDQRVQNVVFSGPADRGGAISYFIYSHDGSARRVLGDTPEVVSLFEENTTVWIQDDKEHGTALENCRCVCILCASPERSNYKRFIKLARSCWLPVWDSNGALSLDDLSLELAALRYVAYPTIEASEMKKRADILGCIPRQICATPEKYQENYKLTTNDALALTYDEVQKALNAVETELGPNAISQRIKYTNVNRETLEAEGSVIVPAYLDCLLRTHTLSAVHQVAKLVESQLALTGDRLAAGKQFERLLLHHLNVGSRELRSRELENAVKGKPSSANAKSLEMETRELEHEVVDGVRMPAMKTVSSLKGVQLTQRSFHVSRDTTEPAIDAIYTSPKEIFLIQATLNKDHTCDGEDIYRLVKHALQCYERFEKPKVIYAILTDYETSSLMTKRKMVSEIKDRRKREQRNKMLADIQQIVLAADPNFFRSLQAALSRQRDRQ